MPERWIPIAIAILATHGAMVALADRLRAFMATAMAATFYLPLFSLAAVGMPVFGQRSPAIGRVPPHWAGW